MPTCDGINDVVALVTQIEAGRTVLANLNGPALFYSDWEAPPSPNDGPVYLASSHTGRVINLNVNVQKQATADAVAAVLQPLKYYVSRGNVWLMFQKAGLSKPVFFKLRKSDVTAIQEWFAVPETQTIHLALNADPFAYGEEVTDSFTITNDPSAATNPMMAAFPDIEGDVMAPLWLTFPTATGRHKIKWASAAYLRSAEGGPTAPSVPYYKLLTSPTIKAAPPTGWTIADQADAGAIGATKRQLNRSGGTEDFVIPNNTDLQVWAGLPVADYRVFCRIVSGDLNMKLLFFNGPGIEQGAAALTEEDAVTWTTLGPTAAATGHRDWTDLGVAAMPGGAPLPDTMFGNDVMPSTSLWGLGVSIPVTGNIGLDTILLVPAGSTDILTRHGSVAFSSDWVSKQVVLDGQTARRYAVGEYDENPGDDVTLPALEMTGALPVVVPNAENLLFFLADTVYHDADRVNDDKATTTLIEYKYNPRYLNDRPALS